MGRNQSHRQRTARETHREILDAGTLGEEFGLAGKIKTDFMHGALADWASDNPLPAPRGEVLGSGFQRIERLPCRCGCRFSEKMVLRTIQHLDLAASRQLQILQSGGDHFGADPRRIAESHADADGRRNFHGIRF